MSSNGFKVKNGEKKLIKFLLSFGPGIFAIGYTIGTGSVTSMIVAGNDFGMDLLWVLLVSCLFSGSDYQGKYQGS